MKQKRADQCEDLWSIICAGGPFDGFSRHNGRVDLRNRQISAPRFEGVGDYGAYPIGRLSDSKRMRKVQLQNVDFSGSIMRHLDIAQSLFVNCRFDRADCRYWSLWSTCLVDCSFTGSRLNESQLGALLPDGSQNHFEHVQFIKSDMRSIDCAGAVFDRCAFDGVKLDNTQFGIACSFKQCVFKGLLRDVMFGERLLLPSGQETMYTAIPQGVLEKVDFSQAVLRDVGFRDVSVQMVIWPDLQSHVIIELFSARLDDIIARLESKGDVEAAVRFFKMEREALGEGRGFLVMHRLDLMDLVGAKRAEEVIMMLKDLLV